MSQKARQGVRKEWSTRKLDPCFTMLVPQPESSSSGEQEYIAICCHLATFPGATYSSDFQGHHACGQSIDDSFDSDQLDSISRPPQIRPHWLPEGSRGRIQDAPPHGPDVQDGQCVALPLPSQLLRERSCWDEAHNLRGWMLPRAEPPRSTPGSPTRNPPATLTKTSCWDVSTPQRLESTAKSMANRFAS